MRACGVTGVAPHYRDFASEDGDPLRFVIVKNLSRRHLDESQRAMVAAKVATLLDGQRADLVEGMPIGAASEMFNVGRRSVARTIAVTPSPCAHISTIRARQTHFCGELRSATQPSSVARSSGDSWMSESVDMLSDSHVREPKGMFEASNRSRVSDVATISSRDLFEAGLNEAASRRFGP